MLHIYWPMMAFVTLFLVVGTIIVLLRWGPRICKVRHVAFPDENEWRSKAYEQPMSYEI